MEVLNTHIRPVRKADNPSLAHIIRAVLEEYDGNRPGFASQDPETDAMFEAYAKPRAAYFVVEDNGTVKGGGGVSQLAGADASVCELQKMYFLPDLRGKGWGKQLLAQCVQTAKDLGYHRMYLETLASMERARQLYGQFGFVALDQPMGSTGHSGCNAWMIRDL